MRALLQGVSRAGVRVDGPVALAVEVEAPGDGAAQ